MINNVILVGRLTRDVELRFTPAGAAVANFTVAVDRRFLNQQGQREADFISCVMWRNSAENFAKFTHKGSMVGIEGRIQTRNYENQQGQRVYVTEVLAENFSLLESKAQSEEYRRNNPSSNLDNQGYSQQTQSSYNYQDQQANPYGNMPQQNTGFNGNSASGNITTGQAAYDGDSLKNSQDNQTEDISDLSDDDLPF